MPVYKLLMHSVSSKLAIQRATRVGVAHVSHSCLLILLRACCPEGCSVALARSRVTTFATSPIKLVPTARAISNSNNSAQRALMPSTPDQSALWQTTAIPLIPIAKLAVIKEMLGLDKEMVFYQAISEAVKELNLKVVAASLTQSSKINLCLEELKKLNGVTQEHVSVHPPDGPTPNHALAPPGATPAVGITAIAPAATAPAPTTPAARLREKVKWCAEQVACLLDLAKKAEDSGVDLKTRNNWKALTKEFNEECKTDRRHPGLQAKWQALMKAEKPNAEIKIDDEDHTPTHKQASALCELANNRDKDGHPSAWSDVAKSFQLRTGVHLSGSSLRHRWAKNSSETVVANATQQATPLKVSATSGKSWSPAEDDALKECVSAIRGGSTSTMNVTEAWEKVAASLVETGIQRSAGGANKHYRTLFPGQRPFAAMAPAAKSPRRQAARQADKKLESQSAADVVSLVPLASTSS